MENIKISIIIPVYGVEEYIENSLNSLVNQSSKNFEIILVDDGCLDNSIQLAKNILEKTCVPYHILKQPNSGQGVARENGIKLAKADWVMFFDPDDMINPFMIENMISLLEKELDVDLIFVNFEYSDSTKNIKYKNNKLEYRFYERDVILLKYLKRKIRLLLPGAIIKKDLFIKHNIKVDEKSRYSEDVYILWLILYCSKKIIYINNAYYSYLVRQNSTMTGANFERILSGYESIDNLIVKLKKIDNSSKIIKYIKPRWILGMMNSAIKVMEFEEFKHLSSKMNYKLEMKKLCIFPEIKARTLAFLFFCSLNFSYRIINFLYRKKEI